MTEIGDGGVSTLGGTTETPDMNETGIIVPGMGPAWLRGTPGGTERGRGTAPAGAATEKQRKKVRCLSVKGEEEDTSAYCLLGFALQPKFCACIIYLLYKMLLAAQECRREGLWTMTVAVCIALSEN